MKKKVKVVHNWQSTMSNQSLRENSDRVLVSEFFNKHKATQTHTPDEIVKLVDILQDTRLAAFVLGLSEESVISVVRGDVFPEGMMFTYQVIADIIGASHAVVSNLGFRLFSNLKRTYKPNVSRERALILASHLGDKILDGKIGSVEAANIIGVPRQRVVCIMNTLAPRKRRSGEVRLYDREVIMMIKKNLFFPKKGEVGRMARRAYPDGDKFFDVAVKSTIDLEGHCLRATTVDVEKIINSVYVDGMTWTDFQKEATRRLVSANDDAIKQIQDIINIRK